EIEKPEVILPPREHNPGYERHAPSSDMMVPEVY
ncbi:MAG TPA: polyphosphate kinase 2, partial [Methylococcaceae bacterium]|nr:polyphosphate kinase 2 [Methylococcaceae bacterium]